MIRSCDKCIFNQKKKKKEKNPPKVFQRSCVILDCCKSLGFTISTSLQTHDMVDILNFNHFPNNLKVVFSVDLFLFL